MRRYQKVPENDHGILVTHCMPLADSSKCVVSLRVSYSVRFALLLLALL